LVIAVHELGHFAIAALFGIKLERLALGLGPALFSGRRRATQFVLGAIPVGAFAQMRGMNPHAVNFDRRDPRSFASKAFWARALIIAAGPLANFVFALAVLSSLYVIGTHVPVPMVVGTVEPGSEAARAQLRPGDAILAVGGEPVNQWSQLVEFIAERPGEIVTLFVRRDEKTFEVQVKPRADEHGRGRIGITQQYVHRRHQTGEAVRKAASHVNSLLFEGFHLLRRLAQENVGAEMVRQVSVASVSRVDAWLRAIAALSLALGVFHLLPFPPLDGGRIALIALEGVMGRPLHPKLESILHAVGTLALIAGLGWLLARDVFRFFSEGAGPAGAAATSTSVPRQTPLLDAGADRVHAGLPDGGAP
jgi:regulator of sigma E protease